MEDLKKDFRNWLLTVKKYKETISLNMIIKITEYYKQ